MPEVHGDAETEIYLGKPNEQKTHEQMALELTALTEQAPTADLTEQIPINTSNPARPRATPRDLHAHLQIGRDFSNWIKDIIYSRDFIDNEDFEVFPKFGENPSGGRPSKEYRLTMDMAKWISLSANNTRGDEARRYFITREKKLRELLSRPQQAIDMSDPLVTARLYIEAEEARRAALLEHGRTRLDLQLSEINKDVEEAALPQPSASPELH